jgi:mRNA-degrading endonuclease RelE of RelBE toxin-antitoxin system
MRYSVLLTAHAARDLRKLPKDVRVSLEITHATGLSQWLVANFVERRIYSATIWKARLRR